MKSTNFPDSEELIFIFSSKFQMVGRMVVGVVHISDLNDFIIRIIRYVTPNHKISACGIYENFLIEIILLCRNK